MMETLSCFELNYWLVLQGIDPAGESRADLRHAIGTSAFVNTQVTKKKDLTQPKDFLVGSLLRKHWEKSAKARGLIPEWDGKAWWARLQGMVNARKK